MSGKPLHINCSLIISGAIVEAWGDSLIININVNEKYTLPKHQNAIKQKAHLQI